jgi:hypothetical protein
MDVYKLPSDRLRQQERRSRPMLDAFHRDRNNRSVASVLGPHFRADTYFTTSWSDERGRDVSRRLCMMDRSNEEFPQAQSERQTRYENAKATRSGTAPPHSLPAALSSVWILSSAQGVAGQSINPWSVFFPIQESAPFGHGRNSLGNAKAALLEKRGKHAVLLPGIDSGEPSCKIS